MNFRTRLVKITAAVSLGLAALGVVSASPAGAAAGDPSQWEQVNEYEHDFHNHN